MSDSSQQVQGGPGGPGAPPLRSESQSLFNIYYLGATAVDRRCSSSVMPWIIEELKLNAAKMRFVWLTPGTEQVTYVADNGQELFSHAYGSILQCCLAVDGISFAYIARREKDDKYLCHVFQALTYEEATSIMNKFKRHAKEEVSVGSTISRGSNSSFDSKKSSGLIFAPPSQQTTAAVAAASSSSSGSPRSKRGSGSGRDRTLCEYQLEYVGKFEVSSPATSKETQVETVDNIIAKVTENRRNGTTVLPKGKSKRRSFSSMLKSIGKGSSSRDTDSVDGIAASNSASSLLDDEAFETNEHSTSSLSLHSQELEEGNCSSSTTDISVTVTSASPDLLTPPMDVHRPMPQENGSLSGTTDGGSTTSEREERRRENLSSPLVLKGLKENGVLEEENKVEVAAVRNSSGSDVDAVGRNGERLEEETVAAIRRLVRATSVSASSEFDTLPELANLRSTLAFQALSLKKIKLMFSGLTVTMVTEQGEEQILNLNVRSISCCAQGSKEGEYVGFTTREGSKKYFCHLLLAQNKKQGSKVLESFRSLFARALSVAMPAALCETCPLKQLHQLCRTLEGVSTQVAQSHLQECLSTLSEADYGRIMKQYKNSEHATQEFTQIVILVALLRQHFQRQQDNHTHRSFGAGGGLEDSSARLRVPALSRAKNALASSIDNLRTRQQQNNNQTTKKSSTKIANGENRTATAAAASGEMASQSLSLPVHSPIFARKTKLDTLMAPISMSPSPSQEHKRLGGPLPVREVQVRERSWSESVKKHKIRELPTRGGGAGGGESPPSPRKEKDRPKERKTKGDRRTPPSPPVSSSSSTKTGKEPGTPRRTRPVSPLTSPPATSQQKRFEAFHQTPRRTSVLGLSNLKGKRASRTPPAQMVSTPVEYPPGVRRGHRRSTSYTCRAEIFESINTPSERKTSLDLLEEFEIIEPSAIDQLGNSWMTPDREEEKKKKKQRQLEEERRQSPRTKARQRWRNAIKQQIMLNKMDKNNKLVQQASSEADLKRLKLCYSDPYFQSVEAEANETWTKILTEQDQPQAVILKALIQGVPPKRRGEVWQFLSSQYRARSSVEYKFPPSLGTKEGFVQLCEESTPYEHNIYVDIGRTFPSHPYFASSQKQGGQATLRRMLHAYAVADSDTGYCQGISFVAGMILMHSKDELSAFKFLHMLMQLYNYRDVYASELINLQLMLYQLSRLLYDLNPNLYYLLKENDVTPFYYAAPWFLTLFASQFPIAFCARVLDLFFYEGPTAIFKIALALLNLHEQYLMECHTMESTCIFLKNKLPNLVLNNMPLIFEEALRIDLGNRLATSEAEFEVMSELSQNAFRSDIYVSDLESVNMVLRKQNSALIEQLAICHGSIRRLETMVTGLQEQLEDQKQLLSKLQQNIATTQQSESVKEESQTEPVPPPSPSPPTDDTRPS